MIELDGTYGEGGGALLRVALAVSTLTGKPFKIENIRAGRPVPGLKPQHLTGIKALKEITGAKSDDTKVGTTELWFQPGKIKGGNYTIDIGTAGSITLLLQALVLPCIFAPSKVTLSIKGGTCGKWQASVDYLKEVLLPQLRRFVKKIDLRIIKRGYYPKGGGEIILEISPKYKSFESLENDINNNLVNIINIVEQGKLEQIRGVLNLSQVLAEEKIDERIVNAAKSSLSSKEVPVNIRTEQANTYSIGGELLLWSVHSQDGDTALPNPIRLGGDALLEKNKSSEEIGKEAAQELIEEIDSGAAVDKHLADQLLQFMALLPGSKIKTSKVTNHCLTNIYVLEKFLPIKFNVENNIISVEKI
ncbi:MAG: RNA 3'-terminal phosphate cyclase [archaeon]|nr:RNA 3'-terminal phosphate cyclase [Nanoarchaeota archaeon]